MVLDDENRHRQKCFRRVNIVMICGLVAVCLQLVQIKGFAFTSTSASACFGFNVDAPSNSNSNNALPFHRRSNSNLNSKPNNITTTTTTITTAVTTTSVSTPIEVLLSKFPLPHLTDRKVVIMVLSRRSSFEVRQGIRETWAAQKDNVYFVLGQACDIPIPYRDKDEGENMICQVAPVELPHHYIQLTVRQMKINEQEQVLLLREQEQFGDLLMMDSVVDVYRTLPQKVKYAYTFVEEHLSLSAQWIVKVDEDFFVRVDEFSKFLLKKFDSSIPTLVGGRIMTINNAWIVGKWKEVPQFRRGGLYPPFPLGSQGHAVTRSISKYIVDYQDALFNYQGEDVSMGIWLDQPQAPPNVVFHEQPLQMVDDGDCQNPEKLVVGHDVTPEQMKKCANNPVPL